MEATKGEQSMSERFNLYVKLRYVDGRIEQRHLLIENIATREEAERFAHNAIVYNTFFNTASTGRNKAERFAHNAIVYNPGVVLSAWIEPAPAKESNQ
jgi:hypothetical protein